MYAALIKNNSITYGETKDPDISEDDILVKIAAAGLNAADILQVSGRYPPPPGVVQDIPGLEYSGTVEKIGKRVTKFKIGDRVMGLTAGGAHAQKLAVNAETALAIPATLGFEEAGGFSEAFFTAYDALILKAALRKDDNLLITGAAGGVGTAATQLGILWGCHVAASVRTENTRKRFAEYFTKYKNVISSQRDTHDSLRITFSNGATLTVIAPESEYLYQKYDVFLELLAGIHISKDLAMANKGARIALIGLLEGTSEKIDLSLLLQKHITLFGSTMRSRSTAEKALLSEKIERDLFSSIHNRDLRVILDSSFPLNKVEEAYSYFKQGGKLGKILLTME